MGTIAAGRSGGGAFLGKSRAAAAMEVQRQMAISLTGYDFLVFGDWREGARVEASGRSPTGLNVSHATVERGAIPQNSSAKFS